MLPAFTFDTLRYTLNVYASCCLYSYIDAAAADDDDDNDDDDDDDDGGGGGGGDAWQVQLVELGPGKGTMVADMLRSFSQFDGLTEGLEVNLVEASQHMSKIQLNKLAEVQKGILNNIRVLASLTPCFYLRLLLSS